MPDELLKVDSTKDNLIEQIRDLREKIDELERFALTSQDIVATSINCSGDIYTVELTDHSALSTIVGWTSYTDKVIEYKKSGNRVFVNFRISGESDDTVVTFTVPFGEGQTGNPLFFCLSQDDGGALVAAFGQFTASTTITLYSTAAAGGWTNSGTKSVYGQFEYEAA